MILGTLGRGKHFYDPRNQTTYENHGNHQPNKTHGKSQQILKQDPGNLKLSEALSGSGLAEGLGTAADG